MSQGENKIFDLRGVQLCLSLQTHSRYLRTSFFDECVMQVASEIADCPMILKLNQTLICDPESGCRSFLRTYSNLLRLWLIDDTAAGAAGHTQVCLPHPCGPVVEASF